MSKFEKKKPAKAAYLPVGAIVGQYYVIDQCVGVGSSSVVYKCHHRDLPGSFLALKILNGSIANESIEAQRFHQEVVASYEVTHPNVVRTYEYIRDGDSHAYTMEFAEGGDLRSRMAGGDKFPIDEVISIVTQICEGLQAIHEVGIIHRDVKPKNIFFSEDGTLKIADFGIARSDVGPQLTNHGDVIGSVNYVSPEYLQSGELDSRSDLYAVGLIAYELICGIFPFHSSSPVEFLTNRLSNDPEPPTDHRNDCPPWLSDFVVKALAREPAKRFQSAQEMLDAIANREIEATPSENVDGNSSDENKMSSLFEDRKFSESDSASQIDTFPGARVERHIIPSNHSRASRVLVACLCVLPLFVIAIAYPGLWSDKAVSIASNPVSPPIAPVKAPAPVVPVASAKLAEPVEPKPVVAQEESVPEISIDDMKKMVEEQVLPEVKENVPSQENSEPEPSASAPVPLEVSEANPIDVVVPPPALEETGSDNIRYRVVKGDTVSHLALRFGVSENEIIKRNDIQNPRKLEVDRELEIPSR